MTREDAETVAESSAFVMLAHYGIDTGSYTFSYVARWAEDKAVLLRNVPYYGTWHRIEDRELRQLTAPNASMRSAGQR